MTLDQLTYFVTIAEKQNLTKAAEQLFISQSALSKAIRVMEEELQTELIRHNVRNFSLTEAGKLFYSYALDILSYYDAKTSEFLSQLQGAVDSIKLGIPPTAGAIYFFSVLHRFRKKYPDISLDISEQTSRLLPDMLINDKIDMAAVIEPFEDNRFAKKIVYKSEVVAVISKHHRLAKESSIPFSELSEEPILMISKAFQFYDVAIKQFRKAGIEPKIIFESYHWEWLFEMSANNQGVSLLPKPLVEKFNGDKVKLLSLSEPDFPWMLSVIYKKNKVLTEPMKSFLKECRVE